MYGYVITNHTFLLCIAFLIRGYLLLVVYVNTRYQPRAIVQQASEFRAANLLEPCSRIPASRAHSLVMRISGHRGMGTECVCSEISHPHTERLPWEHNNSIAPTVSTFCPEHDLDSVPLVRVIWKSLNSYGGTMLREHCV